MNCNILQKIFLVLFLLGSFLCKAQTDSELNGTLDQIVISGSKFAEQKKNISQKIDLINAKQIKQLNAPTMAEVLSMSGKAFVQKSQQGGGSPVIRGFEASRVLLVVDGVRMNNAIYRTGHLQNVITIDNNILDRVEILNGPGSTIFGSDALGGVLSMKTIDPKFTNKKITDITQAQGMLRYASANNEKTVSAGFGLGNKYWATFTNISASQFGNLRQGGHDPNNQLKYWGRSYSVQRIQGRDSMVKNQNPLIQLNSGYNQIDILQKISFAFNDQSSHQLNFQYSTSSNVPRYDRLTQIDTTTGLANHAEWYYGPQKRFLAAYNYDFVGNKKYFDEVNVNVNYQAIKESRFTRKFKNDHLIARIENLNVIGLNLAARKKIKQHEITYGTDGQINLLKSTASSTNITTNQVSETDTRYPDGDNNMNLWGIFVQHSYKWWRGKLVLNDGLRYNTSSLHSSLERNFLNVPFSEINQKNNALTGNLGLIYFPHAAWRVNMNFSRGFRSPNIDDVSKIFDSNSGVALIVPNEKLNPEFTNTVDLGVQFKNNHFFFSAYAFYTYFQNAIVLDEFTFNGQDSIIYDGVKTKIFANQNKAQANVYGAGFESKIILSKYWSCNANMAYTYGRFKEENSLVPLDHVPPLFGRVGFMYQKKKWTSEGFFLFNGTKNISQYNPYGEDNQQFALPSGTPGWYTVNMRTSYDINKHFIAQVGVDNILDRNYRNFASGISAPGRNFILSLRYKM